MSPPPNEKKHQDPALWWLDVEFYSSEYSRPISMVKVRDFWIMVTDHSILKFYMDYDGVTPMIQKLCEF